MFLTGRRLDDPLSLPSLPHPTNTLLRYGICGELTRCFLRLLPGGRDALRKYAGGIFLVKAGSKLCLRPGPKAAERMRG